MIRPVVAVLSLLAVVEADFDAPKFVVDLDEEPLDRWGPLAADLLKMHGWNQSFGPVIDFMTGIIPLDDWKKFDKVFEGIGLGLLGFEYLQEARGIHITATKLGFGDKFTSGMLVFFQLFYELLMECTGLVAQAPDGSVIHGRNMDIGLPVPNITAQVTWTRSGVPVFVSTQYIGYLGVHTGMRLGGWSVQANERVVLEPGPWGWSKSVIGLDVLALLQHHKPVGYVLREALLAAPTFDDAVQQLSDVKMVAPLYFIMAGANKGEGAVITKNRQGLADAPNHKSVLLLNESDTYYLAQTNWDPWMPIDSEQCKGTEEALPSAVRAACTKVLKMIFDNTGGCMELCRLTSDGRRERAVELLDKVPKDQVSTDSLLKVLSDPHVEQGNTQFTALINPHTGDYRTVVRQHPEGENAEPNPLMRQTRELALQLFRSLTGYAKQTVVV